VRRRPKAEGLAARRAGRRRPLRLASKLRIGIPSALVDAMLVTRDLALAGGEPAFASGLPFARPARPPLDRVTARLRPSYEQGILTNGPLVRELEARVAERLGVSEAVAVASCTAGLMLAIQALVRRGGSVLMASFTFAATAHAAAWASTVPRFAECGNDDFLLDVADAAARLDGSAAIVATHVFGAPCHPERVEALAGPTSRSCSTRPTRSVPRGGGARSEASAPPRSSAPARPRCWSPARAVS
jgi:DNA-binding transcriptional MocR family regulator